MPTKSWATVSRAVSGLHLDSKNPRLGRENAGKAPRDIIQFLFDHDKVLDIAKSIAQNGFFVNEPLLAVVEDGRTIVVEGNRRLAALKALHEPGLLEGVHKGRVAALKRGIDDPSLLNKVPVVIAPSRKATDRPVAARHHGERAIRAWTKDNRSSFILDKIDEGYSTDRLRDELNFTRSEVQEARQFRALTDMARSLSLGDEIMAKVNDPRAKFFTNIERVLNSTAGRAALRVEPDPEHGFRIRAKKASFEQAFGRLVTDLVLGNETSRSLNNEADIKRYFAKAPEEQTAEPSNRSLVPANFIHGKSTASKISPASARKPAKRAKPVNKRVIPPSFKVRHGNERVQDLRLELGKIKRDDMPNAGAVLIRIFLELAMLEYLDRKKKLKPMVDRLGGSGKLRYGVPDMRQLSKEFQGIAKQELNREDAKMVVKALTYDTSKVFNLSELNSFVHSKEIPTGRDIEQFWIRMEPLFRLMLEED